MSMAANPDAPQYDWSSRVRTTAKEALRYSKFVSLMKRLLSLGAFLIIAAVLAFFFVQRQPRQLTMSYEMLGRVENDLDAKGNPFVITADMAVQDAKNAKKASLKNLEADLALDRTSWINARARAGMVDMAAGRLELNGGIDLFTDTGYELHSASASMNLKQSVVHGHQEVTGRGPDGAFRADGFHADRNTNLLTLTGNVRMTLHGSNK